MQMNDNTYGITVINDYGWVMDPKLGQFHVFINDKKVTKLLPKEKQVLFLEAGRYEIYMKLWHWYKSNLLIITLPDDKSVSISGNIDMSKGVIKRIGQAMFHPKRSLILVQNEI